MSLKQRLLERLEAEREKTGEDVEWAMQRNPEAANKALKFMRSSIAVKLGVIFGVLCGAYYTVSILPTFQLAAVVYILIGSGVARYSDYDWFDWESYVAVGLWLPIVVYSFLPDRVRIEK